MISEWVPLINHGIPRFSDELRNIIPQCIAWASVFPEYVLENLSLFFDSIVQRAAPTLGREFPDGDAFRNGAQQQQQSRQSR